MDESNGDTVVRAKNKEHNCESFSFRCFWRRLNRVKGDMAMINPIVFAFFFL